MHATCYLPTCIQAPAWRITVAETTEAWLACEKHMTNCVGAFARAELAPEFTLEFKRITEEE